MHVRVDKTGRDDPPSGLNDLFSGMRVKVLADLDDAIALHAKIAQCVDALTRIDDPTASNQHALPAVHEPVQKCGPNENAVANLFAVAPARIERYVVDDLDAAIVRAGVENRRARAE